MNVKLTGLTQGFLYSPEKNDHSFLIIRRFTPSTYKDHLNEKEKEIENVATAVNHIIFMAECDHAKLNNSFVQTHFFASKG